MARGVQRRTGLWAVAALWALVLVLGGCGTAEPRGVAVPEEQIQAMLQRKERAEKLFEQAVAAEDVEEQKRLYGEALAEEPSLGKAYNNLGLIYLVEGDYAGAVRMLREAVGRMPESADARFNLGYAFELIGRLQSAEEQYRAAVRLAPKEPDYLESLARVYIRQGEQLGRARELLEQALGLEVRPEHVKWIQNELETLEKGYVP